MGKQRKWSPKAKFEIALCAIKGDMTMSDICTRYQVSPSQVHAWKKQVIENGADIFVKNNKAAQAAAIEQKSHQRKLYEKIGKLTIERDFLKKSVSKCPLLNDDD